MKRSTAILVGLISIAAAGIFIVIHHSEKSLEFAGDGIGQLDTSGMEISLSICNPSVVPLTLEGIESDLGGRSGNYGSLEIPGKAVAPLSQETLHGRLDFDDLGGMKTFVDWILANESNTDFNATLLVKEKLFGIIPYSYEKSYDLTSFSTLVFGNGQWACQTKPIHASDIRQQLETAQSRLSTANLLYLGKIGVGNSTNSTGNDTALR